MISSIPTEVLEHIKDLLRLPDVSHISDFSFAGGGCISNGGKVTTGNGTFFLKWNDALRYPGMFEAEARGLQLLFSAKAIRVPEVIGTSTGKRFQCLLLQHIGQATRTSDFWDRLGLQLSNLHRIEDPHFGLDHNNYIGSLPQYNPLATSWTEFFIEHRLRQQLQKAIDYSNAPWKWTSVFETLFAKLSSLIPDEKPALLHGDLWNGNMLVDENGQPCLIDPAVYYGHREVDLAMTKLFGGFQQRFYDAYHESFPLAPGFDDRVDLFNLYPLLVHVNLFGGSYIHSVDAILKRFC